MRRHAADTCRRLNAHRALTHVNQENEMKAWIKTLLMAGMMATAGVGLNAMAGDRGCGGPMMGHERMEKMREHHQARLHEALKLSPAQEPAWQQFIASHKEGAAQQGIEKLPALQRVEQRLNLMQAHLAALREFYAVLTPEQRKAFDDAMPHPGREPGMPPR
jgi:Spy/CpxP family protein refolding chaperone